MVTNIKSKAAIAAIISCICLLASCGHKSSSSDQSRQVDPTISPVLKRMQGSWISSDYMTSLSKTRSPLRSAAYIEGIFSFIIDSNKMAHDTLYFTALTKGSEESNFWIVLGKRDPAGLYSAGQRMSGTSESTSENVTKARIDSQSITLFTAASDSLRYVYYDDVYKGRPADYMLKHYTTKALFAGEYWTLDSTIVFGSPHIGFDATRSGRILGSPIYDSFDINVDIVDQKDTVDYIEFYDTKGVSESHSYTYRLKANTLKIYPLQEGEPCRLTLLDSTSR